MEIERTTAIRLLQDVGLTHADKYSMRELIHRVRRLPNVVDENTEVRTPESDALYERLLTALANQEPVNIVGREPVVVEEMPDGAPVEDANDDSEEQEAPKPKSKDKKKQAAPAAKTPDKKPAAKKKAKGERGPGVIGTIVEILQGASQKKALTLDKIVDELAKRFPEREKKSMLSTVKVQISGRIQRERGLKVKHNDKGGYWIEGGKK